MSKMGEESALSDNERSILYSYWHEDSTIDIFKIIPLDIYRKNQEKPITSQILDLLRKGIEDNSDLNIHGRRRYALSIHDILTIINQNIDESTSNDEFKPIKKTALYYHRDYLLDSGLIKEVATFLEGKRHVTYYGRTAKAFIVSEDEREYFHNPDEFRKTILQFNPKYNEKALDILMDTLASKMKVINHKTKVWLQTFQSDINKLDSDVFELTNLVHDVYAYTDQSITKLFAEIGKLLKIFD